ncbi:MAG: MFS transporter [Phycisphaerae bacterium]|nr:MFS transporter [Tepidisphaeraceae bacterium]
MSQAAAVDMPPLARQPVAGVMPLLSVMMFIQFFIWGAWYVSMGPYMAKLMMSDATIGTAYTLSPIGAIIAPFFLGLIADRFFASERVLAVLHLLGGVAMLAVPTVAGWGSGWFLGVILFHCVCFMPTINLSNSVAFTHLTDQEKQFPMIRVFGTAGWIVANWTISLMGLDTAAAQFYIAGIAAVALAGFSLFLPHTPPPSKGRRVSVGEIVGVGALRMFKSRSFAVFAICSFLISIPLAAYYNYAGRMVNDILTANDPASPTHPTAAWMSIGQAAEVVFMLAMPWFFRRLGVKWMLAVGMLSWVARYALFAAGAPGAVLWVAMLGVALHGLCYDFFFVTGFIYTDKRAAKRIRGQAQGMVVLLTYGLGLGLGGYLVGQLGQHVFANAVTAADRLALFQKFWFYPAVFAAAVLVLFVVLFRDDSKEPPIGEDDAAVARSEAAAGAAA